MNNSAIALAAAATFAAVYWLTPGPPAVAEPSAIAEAAVPEPPAGAASASAAAAAGPAPARLAAKARGSRVARRRRTADSAAAGARALGRPAPRRAAASVYFSGCNEVRALGLAPLLRGQPGYRGEMDGDDDGIACEAPRGGRRRR